ncbi:MAG: DUF2085 domain-containing protein [Burkholderiales bacterium]|nr:DUF2085 domain-containing protein [Anaerolineae bacterium]
MAQPARPRTGAQRINLFLLTISRHWLRIAVVLLTIYVTLPFLAPTLMKLGITGPARALYFIYSPLCHQFGFRTFFLYGEQPFYPREITGANMPTFEEYVVDSPQFMMIFHRYLDEQPASRRFPGDDDPHLFTPSMQFAAREFLGDERMGYKMTLCARDIAIYLAMLLGALLYSRVRRRLRPAPIWLYVLLGLAPIALDGFSQLLGYAPFNLWPTRETLPIFRVVTGAMFGLMNVWLGFPYLEASFKDTREELEEKFERAGIAV